MGKAKEKKKVSDVVIIIVTALLVAGFVGSLIYVFMRNINKDGEKEKATVNSEVDKLINKNIDARYPETPSQLVDLYCSITQALHDKDVTEEQITKLHSQMRKLFDEELLANNDYDEHLKKLKKEIEAYKKVDMVISRYAVEENEDITIYVNEEGRDECKVLIAYSFKDKSGWKKSYEEVLLRKDEEGNWKILGWLETDAPVSE